MVFIFFTWFDLICTILLPYLQKYIGQATLGHYLIDLIDYQNTLVSPTHVDNNIRMSIPIPVLHLHLAAIGFA